MIAWCASPHCCSMYGSMPGKGFSMRSSNRRARVLLPDVSIPATRARGRLLLRESAARAPAPPTRPFRELPPPSRNPTITPMTQSPAPTAGPALPDPAGHFGLYGGVFVPETLIFALRQLEDEYRK